MYGNYGVTGNYTKKKIVHMAIEVHYTELHIIISSSLLIFDVISIISRLMGFLYLLCHNSSITGVGINLHVFGNYFSLTSSHLTVLTVTTN